MVYFLKLNAVSMMYAFVFFVHTELIMNVYRIERITGWTHINKWIDWMNVLIFVTSIVLFYFLSRRWLSGRYVKYLTTILWLPYFYLFIHGFAALYPLTNPQEVPLPVMGLIVLGEMILFPFYIAVNNFISGIRITR